MSKKSLLKRIFTRNREDEVDEDGVPVGEVVGEPVFEASAAGDAAARPSITEILFRRRGDSEEEGPEATQEGEDVRTLAPDRYVDKRLNRKEETAQRMSEGFENLSGLLSSINEKLKDGNDRGRSLAESIEELPEVLRSIPETSRAQIEFLGTISKQLDLQTVRSGELVEHFSSLPEILKSIPESQRAQAEQMQAVAQQLSESSARQLGQFQGMQKAQNQTLVAFQNTQNKSLNLFHKAQQQSLAMFKGAQTAQARQIEEFVAGTQRSLNRALIACAVIVSLASLGVAAMIFLA